jgi:hypothetical protein
MLRAFGAALCFAAWRLYDAREAPEAYAALLYGQPVEYAMLAYGVLGLLLAVPVALPRAILHPASVLTGATKAFLLVALVLVTLPVADVLIAAEAPVPHRDALRDAVPPLLRGLAGTMIVATIVLAFLRQLAGPMRRDGMGRPIAPLEPDDLRALRASRMGS